MRIADKYIKSLTDKHFYCDLENNLENFYIHDLHPNEKGYQHYKDVFKLILFDLVSRISDPELKKLLKKK